MELAIELEDYSRELSFEDISSELYMHLQDIHTDADRYYIHVFGFSRYNENERYYKSFLGIDEAYLALKELIEEDKWHLFIPHSTLFTFKRKTQNVARINAFFADIDKTSGFDKMDVEAVLNVLDTHYFDVTIPRPSKVISTGGGIQIFWLLKNAPKQALRKWQKVEERIFNELFSITEHVPSAKLDQKCKDVVRNTRPPGTKNYRYGENGVEVVALRNSSVRYTIDGIIKEYFPELQFEKNKVLTEADIERIQAERDAKMERKRKWLEAQKLREERAKIKPIDKVKEVKVSKTGKTQGTLIAARERDLFLLIELRDYEMEGYRYSIITIYGWLKVNKRMKEEELLELCKKMNNKFRVPLTENEVKSIANSIYKTYHSDELGREHEKALRKELENRGIIDLYCVSAKLRFTNKRCIEWLDITPEEQDKMETIISKRKKYDRNNEKRCPKDEDGYSKKKLPIKERRAKVKELMDKGYKQKQIAEALGIDVEVVKNDRKAINKAQK